MQEKRARERDNFVRILIFRLLSTPCWPISERVDPQQFIFAYIHICMRKSLLATIELPLFFTEFLICWREVNSRVERRGSFRGEATL